MPRKPRIVRVRIDEPGLSERYQFRLRGGGILRFFLYPGEPELLGLVNAAQPISAQITHVDELGFRLRPDGSDCETAPDPPPWWPDVWAQIVLREQMTRFSRRVWPSPTDFYLGITNHPEFFHAAVLPGIACWTRRQWQSGEITLDESPAALLHVNGWESKLASLRAAGQYLTRSKRGRRASQRNVVQLSALAFAECLRLRDPTISIREAVRIAAMHVGWTKGKQRKSDDIEDVVDSLVRAWNRVRAK